MSARSGRQGLIPGQMSYEGGKRVKWSEGGGRLSWGQLIPQGAPEQLHPESILSGGTGAAFTHPHQPLTGPWWPLAWGAGLPAR